MRVCLFACMRVWMFTDFYWLQLVIWMLLSVAIWWLDCVLSGRRGMRRMRDSGRESVRDGHSALHNAFNGWGQATGW